MFQVGRSEASNGQHVLSADKGLPANRILIQARNKGSAARAIAASGGRLVREIPVSGVQVVELPDTDQEGALARVRRESGVVMAEADEVAEAFDLVPDDPSFPNQWGLAKIQAAQAWDPVIGSSGDPSVAIAVLDTGIDLDHEDLAGKILESVEFSTSDTTDDLYGHGTHAAGIAAATTNNATGVAGAGFATSLYNVKVLGDNGSGYMSDIASGIYWATDKGAKVISMSLGATRGTTTLQDAVNYAVSHGVVVVAAAGNNGTTSKTYPAGYDACIAVAATTSADQKASFSNYSNKWVDVAAPGVDILSTLPNHPNALGANNYGLLSGTSMATPFVAGEAALIWWKYGVSNTASFVRNKLESTCDPISGTGRYWAKGRINMGRALNPLP
jgi:thermitase